MGPSLGLKLETAVRAWSAHLATRAEGLQLCVRRRVIERTDHSDVISFAGGLPAFKFFPYRELAEARRYALREQGANAFHNSMGTTLPLTRRQPLADRPER